MSEQKTAVMIGAGPAGLTAALEFVRRSSVKPVVFEASQEIGGISRTVRYKGNRMDIGGHRFFSKSDRVMDWWREIMPITSEEGAGDHAIRYQNRETRVSASVCAEGDGDLVMLVRPRKSRIYFLRSFFNYPLSLDAQTLRQLGFWRTVKIGTGYIWAKLFPRKPELTLEDFLINRFGMELYLTFFKSYTEKVWGVPCNEISAEWGAQRIKGLSLRTALVHFIRKALSRKKPSTDIAQKGMETSLIEKFLYPKLGPGQLWEHVAEMVQERGGEIATGWKVTKLHVQNGTDETDGTDKANGVAGKRIRQVEAVHESGERRVVDADYIFSTMPIRQLIEALDCPEHKVPSNVREVSDGLVYRDFITVGLLVDRLTVTELDGSLLKDTWIYIQEPDVTVGRLQIFNNWSPYMVADPTKVWIGLEYFCYDSDPLWHMSNDEIARYAIAEIEKIGILNAADVRDAHVVRVPKTYPAYFGTYNRFDEIVDYMNTFENLYLVGRNGMHKYNNQDHSMLTAMSAVDDILAGRLDKAPLWKINTEQEYHENRKS